MIWLLLSCLPPSFPRSANISHRFLKRRDLQKRSAQGLRHGIRPYSLTPDSLTHFIKAAEVYNLFEGGNVSPHAVIRDSLRVLYKLRTATSAMFLALFNQFLEAN